MRKNPDLTGEQKKAQTAYLAAIVLTAVVVAVVSAVTMDPFAVLASIVIMTIFSSLVARKTIKKYPPTELTDEMYLDVNGKAAQKAMYIILAPAGLIGAVLIYADKYWEWAVPVGATLMCVFMLYLVAFSVIQHMMIKGRTGNEE